jgi:hypothetical protein
MAILSTFGEVEIYKYNGKCASCKHQIKISGILDKDEVIKSTICVECQYPVKKKV